MTSELWYITWLPVLPVLLTHLTGVVVASVLLLRRRSTPALLALLGFSVLFIVTLADMARPPLLTLLPPQISLSQVTLADAGLGCCCSLLDVSAFVALIIALWQAIPPATSPIDGESDVVEATWEEVPERQ